MAIIPSKKSSAIVPVRKSSAIIKADKFFGEKKEPKISQKTTRVKPSNQKILQRIEKKVIKIDKILKNSLLFQKKENEKKRKEGVDKSFAEKEKEFEKKKPKQEKGPKLPSKPGLGLFDTIKNYIGNVIFGFFAVRLIDFLPTLLSVVPHIISVTDFITDWGGKLLNGLVTFVDWGYKAIDATRGFIKNIGGEGLAKNFDMFASTIDNLIEVAIIAALATADSGGGGDLLDFGKDLFKRRTAQQAVQTAGQQAAGSVGRTAGIGAGAAAGIVAGAGLLASALGEGAFQVRKFAVKPIQKLENDQKNDKNPLTKIGRGIVLNMVRPLYGLFQTVGFLLDVVGAPFRYAIELLRYPFLSDEDKQKQATNLAKFDARIREDLRRALNMLTFGLAFKEKGSFGNIYGNKDAQKEMMSKMAGGGQASTRGGKTVTGPVKRTIKKTPVRIISVKPKEVNPGASIGGKDKIQKIFPEPTISEEGKTMDPYGYMKSSSDKLSETFGFGGLFSLITKTQLGDKPSKNDYQSAAQGLMAWMQTTFSSQILRTGGAFAEGGEVDVSMFNYDEDMKNIIAKSLQDSVAPKIDDTINDLMKQLGLKEIDRGKKPGEGPGAEDEPTGSPTLVGNTNAEKVFKYLVDKEGFTPEAAAGIIGNLMQESSVNPKSRQSGGPGRGIMQWSEGERWASLSAWANNSGKDPWALETQVEWMIKEMKDYGTYNRIKGVSSYKKAVEIFESEMEKAGKPNYPRRYQFAADALASFSPGAGGKGVPLGNIPGNLSEAKKIASSMGLQMTSYIRPGDPGYHGKGRAMDFQTIGAPGNSGTPSQMSFAQAIIQKYGTSLKQLIYTPLGYGIANGKQVGLDYWGEKTNSQHYHHVHVAFEKGGKVNGLTKAILGEKGAEFVIDADSTRALEENYPGFLNALNKADYTGALHVLQNYTSYESGAETFIIIPDQDQNDYQDAPSGYQPVMIGGGGSVNSDMQFEDSLMYG